MQRSRHGRGAFSGGAGCHYVFYVLFVLLLINGVPSVVLAVEADPPAVNAAGEGETETTSADNASDDSAIIPTLPPLLVTGSLFDLIPSSTTLTHEQIESLPARNGTLNEVLPLLPGIQASDLRSPSDRGGEIEAPELSISGAAFYQNTFRIDGVAIDSKLDPAADNPNDINNIPGQSTDITISTRLVEQITVYDHSVPARYGNFTGGVVDVSTRSPGTHPGGAVHLRTTRDNWSHIHVAPEKEESFHESRNYLQQPEFSKYDLGAELEVPLPGESGALAVVQTVSSQIRLNYFDGHKTQTRRSDQYFLKWRGELTRRDDLSVSFNATPKRSEYFIESARGSDFTLGEDNYLYAFNWIRTLPVATVTTSGGFGLSEHFRAAPGTYYNWQVTPSKSWGTLAGLGNSREGGFDSLEQDERSLQLNNHWDFSSFASGPLRHQFNTGLELSRSDASFSRAATSYTYTLAAKSSNVVCSGDSETCVDGEQYFNRRSIYSSGYSSARIHEGSFYLEDNIVWGPLEVRPGVRLSMDDYTGNSNLAPRFAAAWEIFGGKSTVLLAGINRYYGKVLLTDALRTAQQPTIFERRSLVGTQPGPWTFSSQTNILNSSADLKTPYNDEISAGIDLALLGGRLKLDYVRRQGYDEVASETSVVQPDGKRYRTFNNNGRSHYESWRSSWQRNWHSGELFVNLTYAESQSSIEDYNTSLDEAAMERQIMYNGEKYYKDEIPRSDYNRTWTGNLTWLQRLPAGFDFTNVARYRSGYHAIEFTGERITDATAEEFDEYADVKHGQSWIFDWVLGWTGPQVAGVEIRLSAEILNVFNSKVELGEYSDRFEMGRQFWAGMEGKF